VNAALEAAILHKLTPSGAYMSRSRAHYQKNSKLFKPEKPVQRNESWWGFGFDVVILLRDQLPPLQDFLDFFNVEIKKFGRANFKGYVHGTPLPMFVI